MYESGQSSSADDVEAALRRLEAALSRHQAELGNAAGAEPPALTALRRHVSLMRGEADRLRELLAP
jgi:hypothetical protein